MKSANQLDALVAFGTDPIRKLAVPRFISLFVMLPVLVILGDAIALMGGKIELSSEPERGSTFSFRVRAGIAPAPESFFSAASAVSALNVVFLHTL